ncbi:MAG: magnesium chelatase ATPase subunit D, partial [Anaerolineae bacterium]
MSSLPFAALVGLERAQQALLMLAVDPRLGGVVLAAPAGTGKSSLVRGLRAVLGEETPFVEVPASVDVENLLGGLDIEATLRTGSLVMKPGVLAKAHGGLAYVDGINLLTDSRINALLSVLDEGEVRLEREGVSLRYPARFSLIGSYDPAEGQPRRHLIDRLGLIVPLPGQADTEQREAVLRNNLLGRPGQWSEDSALLRGIILTARDQLPDVRIGEAYIEQLAAAAVAYGVEGHRADLFAVRAACAAAAIDLREEVNGEDCEIAARLVILPRATRIPQPPPPPPAEEPPTPEPEQVDSEDAEEDPAELPETIGPQPELILEALASDLPDAIADLSFEAMRRGQTGSRGATTGKRGRHIRSIPGDPNRGRSDISWTLRAAAPWQPLREAKPGRRYVLGTSDIRIKQYRSKAGVLFCFAVDASGSMALHRMRQAKGAVHALLERAYVNRDRVALMAFRGEQAELLMPPSQSVELARRALDFLPTGGGTPLASALLLGYEIAQQARRRGILQTVLVVLTDGRGNVPLRPGSDPQEELRTLG